MWCFPSDGYNVFNCPLYVFCLSDGQQPHSVQYNFL
uniref:Uncharacterized protein n=1 Tax=Anguilla anguilla TaxID=7936 RepID=A0A0E9QRY6_ANGAN